MLTYNFGAERDEPTYLARTGRGGPQVEVLAVLRDLRLGHTNEPETGTTPARRLNPGAVGVLSSSTFDPSAAAQKAATCRGSRQSKVTDLMKETMSPR